MIFAQASYVFTVSGPPIPQGRPRAGLGTVGQPQIYSPAGTEEAREDIRAAFRRASGLDWEPWAGPVAIRATYSLGRSRDHWAGRECVKRPDLDNLDKMLFDALNGVAYRDDAQIVSRFSRKVYGERELTRVEISFYHPTEKPKKIRRQGNVKRDGSSG